MKAARGRIIPRRRCWRSRSRPAPGLRRPGQQKRAKAPAPKRSRLRFARSAGRARWGKDDWRGLTSRLVWLKSNPAEFAGLDRAKVSSSWGARAAGVSKHEETFMRRPRDLALALRGALPISGTPRSAALLDMSERESSNLSSRKRSNRATYTL